MTIDITHAKQGCIGPIHKVVEVDHIILQLVSYSKYKLLDRVQDVIQVINRGLPTLAVTIVCRGDGGSLPNKSDKVVVVADSGVHNAPQDILAIDQGTRGVGVAWHCEEKRFA